MFQYWLFQNKSQQFLKWTQFCQQPSVLDEAHDSTKCNRLNCRTGDLIVRVVSPAFPLSNEAPGLVLQWVVQQVRSSSHALHEKGSPVTLYVMHIHTHTEDLAWLVCLHTPF